MIDILFLAFNRLEFTRETLAAMVRNTDWDRVRRIVVYDDGSTDGTREHLQEFDYPVDVEIRHSKLGSPVAIMNEYLGNRPADVFAKIDNDTVLPPGWLTECLNVMNAHAELDLLGIEAFNKVKAGDCPRGYQPARFIGGIGLMRRRCFKSFPRPNGRFGFTQWQRQNAGVVKGWINPSLPVFLLDKMFLEPWLGLSNDYIAKGWQRQWPPYSPIDCALWKWKYSEKNGCTYENETESGNRCRVAC
jgi:glycosyltransferase involved in cell wall biosynthesis